ncbi:putative zinc finger BED domain-containing protein 4-like, partial [Triplophysa rosa]
MLSHCLTTIPLEERHTAANIAECIQDVTAKFDIPPEKIKAVVHDNSANVAAAAKFLNEQHGWASVWCAGHTLNLVEQSSLKIHQAISKCVAAVRCIVEHFKKSELACTKLKEKQQQMGTETRGQKMSKVWDHFKLKSKENTVMCVHCKIELAYHNSTSSMLQHLNRKHPIPLYYSETGGPSPETSKTTSQLRMDRYVRTATSCSTEQAAEFSDSILNMIVTDMRPLSMVEDDGFKAMISTFNPKYELPSRTFFMKKMEKKYECIKGKLKKALQETDSIALTTDIWTSVATEAYLGVTCHYLGEDWEMLSHCLTTMPLEERHTAANIAEWIQDVTAKFDIPPEKIKAVVHDNGANVVAAAKILHERHGWTSVRCAGHTLNLVVQSSLKIHQAISKCVAAVRCLVEHFKKSELACTKLKEKQQQMGTETNMLVQDACTRWNSTYHMLFRLLEQRWPVTATLSDPAVTQRGKHYLDLKPEQWNLIEELSQVLEPFEASTVFLSGQQYVTLSALPQLVHKLKKNIERPDLESAPVRSFQAHATEQITARWQGLMEFTPESPNITLLAAALDPRFRKLKFLPADQVFKVQSTVQTMALAVAAKKQARQPTPSENGASSTAHDSPEAHAKRVTSFLDILGSDSSTSDEEDDQQQLNQTVQRESELKHWSPWQGIRAMHKRVRDVRGIQPCYRNDVGVIMSELDASGLIRRCPGIKKIERRKYFSRGPNYTWHIDGNDKLKFFGIWVHLGIDGFSRKIIWLKAGTSNRKQSFIARYFYDAVQEHGGCPRIVRADRGTENLIVGQMQVAFHFRQASDQGRDSFRVGKSVHNQRAEFFNSMLKKTWIKKWQVTFE